ncbi:MAG: B-box zinc finger protein [Myxococcaceae bacterium]|nr:B-box zinc finger protein [Myxococcaceae bacterium]
MSFTACSVHPRARAGWACATCERQLCPDCVATKKSGWTDVLYCVPCGGTPKRLLKRRDAVPLRKRVPGAFGFPLTSHGLLTMVAGGVVLWVLGFLGWLGAFLAAAVTWGYVFTQAKATAAGSHEVTTPEGAAPGDLVVPALRGLLTSVVWVPLVWRLFTLVTAALPPPTPPAALKYVTGSEDLQQQLERGEMPPEVRERLKAQEERERAELEAPYQEDPKAPRATPDDARARDRELAERMVRKQLAGVDPLAMLGRLVRVFLDPWLWFWFVVGLVWWPLTLLLAAADAPILSVFNPVMLVRVASRLGSDLVVLLGSLLAVSLLGLAVSVLGWTMAAMLPVPVLPAVLARALGLYPQLVSGRIIGLCLYVRGADLGYLHENEAYEAEGPDEAPRGKLPEYAPPPPAVKDFTPIELAPVAAPAPSAPKATLAPEAAAGPPVPTLAEHPAGVPLELARTPETYTVGMLEGALAEKNAHRTVGLFQSLVAQATPIPGALLLQVGRAATSIGQHVVAAHALTQATNDAETAPTALVLLGRIYLEKLGDPGRAQHVFQVAAARYPQTEAGRFAAERLKTLAAPQ